MYPTEAGRTTTAAEFLERLSSLPLPYQPGTVWEYGFGLDVLGLIIESVTGQTLGNYFQTQIFKPLGMTDTQFTIPREKIARYVKALANDPETGQPQPSRNLTRKWECGGACFTSTAGDYLRFAYMLTTPGIVRMSGSVGMFLWGGATGTYWWADPAEEVTVVWMTHTPGSRAIVRRHWQMIHALVNQAIID